jgi:hypothetical protein
MGKRRVSLARVQAVKGGSALHYVLNPSRSYNLPAFVISKFSFSLLFLWGINPAPPNGGTGFETIEIKGQKAIEVALYLLAFDYLHVTHEERRSKCSGGNRSAGAYEELHHLSVVS